MLLKRIYKPREKDTDPFVLDYISLGHTGVAQAQNFSTGLVLAAVSEGWMTLSKGAITLHAHPEDLVYKITRGPGRWCLHCGEKLDDDALGETARAHVVAKHKDAKSPDASHPAGYVMVNGYECVLDEAQHARYKVAKPGRPPRFQRREATNG